MTDSDYLEIPAHWIGAGLTPPELILMALIDQCWQEGQTCPSDEFLIRHLYIHPQKVQRLMRSLDTKGWIIRESAVNRSLQGGRIRYIKPTERDDPPNELCLQCGTSLPIVSQEGCSGHGRLICERCAGGSRDDAHAPISERLRWQVFKRDGYACLSCGATEYLRADHVVPRSEGGPTEIGNLQTLCRSCNSRKGTKTADYRVEA